MKILEKNNVSKLVTNFTCCSIGAYIFGRGKISDFMTDLASGIKSFRKGMADDDNDENASIENKDDDN